MHGLMHKGYGPDGTYPSRVVYLDHEDVLWHVESDRCLGDTRLPGQPCPGVFYTSLEPGNAGDEVTVCPVHGGDVRIASVDELDIPGLDDTDGQG